MNDINQKIEAFWDSERAKAKANGMEPEAYWEQHLEEQRKADLKAAAKKQRRLNRHVFWYNVRRYCLMILCLPLIPFLLPSMLVDSIVERIREKE